MSLDTETLLILNTLRAKEALYTLDSAASSMDEAVADTNHINANNFHHNYHHHHHNHKTYAFDSDSLARSWFQIVVDSSHLITFFISIMVIVYASFKSLRIDKNLSELRSNSESEKKKTNINESSQLSSSSSDSSVFIETVKKPVADDEDTEDSDDDDEDDESDNDHGILGRNGKHGSVQTIDSKLALLIPVAASLSLLLMFYFFESIQTAFVLCTSILATIAFSYLLTPVCKYSLKCLCSIETVNKKRRICFLGKYRLSELSAFFCSSVLILAWIITGHWLLMDIIGIGFCITFIAIVRLPSLKVSTLLLVGLVVYDVLWVYFSHLVFSSNVMVRVATREADNPINFWAKKFNIDMKDSPKLSLPGKLVVPSYKRSGNFSILGLGDIVIPGLLLCFVLRFDAYKRNQLYQVIVSSSSSSEDEETVVCTHSSSGKAQQPHKIECECCSKCKLSSGVVHEDLKSSGGAARLKRYFSYPMMTKHSVSAEYSGFSNRRYSIRNLVRFSRLSYFHCSLIGYFLGLITATLSSEIFREAQPALLFLVPFTLLPLLIMAYVKGDLYLMWNEPFSYTAPKYFYI